MPKANTRARGARANRRNPQPTKNDADLTLAEWKKVTTEVLRLKCQDLNLITTGKNPELAQRLFDKYHPIVPNPPILVDIGDEEDQLPGTDDTIRYGDDGDEDPLFPNDNNQEQRDELRERLPEERTEEDEQEAGTEHEIRISKTKFLEMIQTVVENSLQGLFSLCQ